MRAAAIAGVLMLLGACSEVPEEEWSGTIEERDGVTYVTNPREGIWQDRDPPPIHFELEQVFGADAEPEEEILGFIGLRGVTVDGAGNVYIYDLQGHQLFSFAPDGYLRWKAGREGQGPGEFNGAEGIAWNGDSAIYVGNARGQRLDLWSTEGEFLESRATPQGVGTGTLIGFLDPQTVALEGDGTSRAGGEIGIVELATGWRALARVDVDVASGDLGSNGAFISMVASGGFVTVGDIDSYEIRFYDRHGELVRLVSRDFEEMVGFAAAEDRSPLYSWLYPAFQLTTGHWLVNSAWADVPDPAADLAQRQAAGTLFSELPFRSSFDLFDRDGRFLYALVNAPPDPGLGVIETIGPDGKLYTSMSDPFPQVRRYRVEIDES